MTGLSLSNDHASSTDLTKHCGNKGNEPASSSSFTLNDCHQRLSLSNEPASSTDLTNHRGKKGNEPASSSSPTVNADCRQRLLQSSFSPHELRNRKRGRQTKLIEEPIFDPLDDGKSDSDFELDDLSDDESLEGENDEWFWATKRTRTGDSFSSSIDVTQPLPRLVYEDIPILFQGPEEAGKVSRSFVVERRTELMPGDDETTMGCTPGI